MIGLILCGHGEFPQGLKSGVELIIGKYDNIIYINFDNIDYDELSVLIEEGLNELKSCKEVIICVDILGGSPFKVAFEKTIIDSSISIISGINLPMLLSLILYRDSYDSAIDLAIKSISESSESTKLFNNGNVVE